MNQEAVCSYPATSGKKAKEMSVYAWCVHCCLFVVVVVVVCFQFFFFFLILASVKIVSSVLCITLTFLFMFVSYLSFSSFRAYDKTYTINSIDYSDALKGVVVLAQSYGDMKVSMLCVLQ